MADEKVQPGQEPAQLEPAGKPEVTPEQGVDPEVLLAELQKLDVQTPEKIQGMATASREAGNLAAMMGTLRQENAELRDLIQSGQKTPAPQHDPYDDSQSVDIEKVVRRAVSAEYDEKERVRLEATQKVQQQQMQEYNAIVTDDFYSLVKDKWEDHARSPQVAQRVGSGASTYMGEYNVLVRSYLLGMLKDARGMVETVVQGGAGKTTPPHVERSSGQAPPLGTPEGETKEEALAKVTKNWEGTDRDIGNMIKAVLPDGDDFMSI